MPGTLTSGGNILYAFNIAPVFTPAAVGANTTAEQSFNLPGLQINDSITVSFYGPSAASPGAQTSGIGISNCRASAANTLQIGFSNSTAGSLTPAAGVYYMCICRPELPIQSLPVVAA